MDPKLDQRVGIIGAGPAGVSAAWYLKEKGYQNVTILEKNEDVGGKCLTVDRVDSAGKKKNYELGAEYIPYHYYTLQELCEKVNQKLDMAGDIQIINKEGGGFSPPLDQGSTFTTLAALWRYFWLVAKYNEQIMRPCNTELTKYPELVCTAGELIKKHSLEPLKELFLVEQFGYGTFETFPAINMMRTVPRDTVIRIFGDKLKLNILFSKPIASKSLDGTQGIFRKMSAVVEGKNNGKQAFYFNQKISSISTKDNKTTVVSVDTTTNKEEKFEFDVVIFATSPKDLLQYKIFADADQDLVKNNVRHNDYFVGLFETVGPHLPSHYYNNMDSDPWKTKKPVQLTKRWEDSNIVARGYPFNPFKQGDSGEVSKDVEKIFGTFMKDRLQQDVLPVEKPNIVWTNYYPHVPIKKMQEGIYDRFDCLQGKNNYYFTGSFWSMECMEQAINHAKMIVEKNF